MATVVLTLMSQGSQERESDDGPPVQPRDRLTFTELIRSEYQGTAPVDNRYFMPLGTWKAARHEFEGTLIVPEFVMHNSGEEADSTDPRRYFPGFTVDFFTHENYLVPTSRETIHAFGDRSYWRIILSPGTVWSEPGDRGMSRSSFPFTLVSDVYNEDPVTF
jgi:hypothetical protein